MVFKYKFKLQPGLLERKHFLSVCYPWTNVWDTTLDKLYNKFEGQELLEKLAEFKDLFSLQYKIYGINRGNSFYIGALETFYGWTNVLGEEKYGSLINLDRGVYLTKLEEFYGKQNKFISILSRLRKHSYSHPEREGNIETYLETFKKKIDSLIESGDLDGDVGSRLFKELEFISRDYLGNTEIYYNNKKTLEEFALARGIPSQNQRLNLLKRISDILNIEDLKVGDLSRFLFNDEDYLADNFLRAQRALKRPEYFILEWIKNSLKDSNEFSLNEFAKKAILMEINKWISENPYAKAYLNEKSIFNIAKYGKGFHIKEFKILESVYRIYINNKQSPRVSGSKIKDLFGVNIDLTKGLTTQNVILVFSDLQKVLEKTKEFEIHASNKVSKEAYNREIKVIEKYITYREDAIKAYIGQKYIVSPRLQDLRKEFEKNPSIRAFDVMMLLGRDLGTEPIFFDDLDGNIFLQTNQKDENYARQHIDPSKFWSLYVSRMFLTTRTYHGGYPDSAGRGKISVSDQQLCLEGLHILMERGLKGRGFGKDGLINEQDIKEVFIKLGGGSMATLSDGRSVLEWWKQGSSSGVRQSTSFDLRLARFNEKIMFKRDHKVDSSKLFIGKFYEIAYDRFWDAASREAGEYYKYCQLRGIGKYISIPDVDLMRRIFPEQKRLEDYF